LLIPTDYAASHKEKTPTKSGRRTAVRITSTQPPLSPVIGSAAAIQRFLDRYPGDKDALKLFHISYQGRHIPWSEFCYGDDRSATSWLAQRLTSGPQPAHPIAIHGTITESGTARSQASVYAEQDLHTKITHGGQPRWLYVRLRTRDARLTASLTPGRRFLAVGSWRTFCPEKGRSLELVLWLSKPWQIASWDVETAGEE
jgi:hypothetical protein